MTGPANAVTTAAMVRPADMQFSAGHLGNAKPVPGLAALNVGGSAEVSAVRCPSPGFCTAAGDYIDRNGHHQAFVVSQVRFAWGKAIPVPGLAAFNNGGPTDITALSCPTAGNCTVGGWFVDTSGNLQPFVAESTHGTFGKALALFTIDDQISQFTARVAALSCAKPRNCSAALILPTTAPGGGEPIPQAFLITETNGKWGPLRPVPGISDPGTTRISGITSVSCWAPGDCMAVGGFGDVGSQRPILAVQEGGSWSAENTIPGLDGPAVIDFNPSADSFGQQVSCWAFTACTVDGVYGDHHGHQQVFVADWVNGSWATQTIPGSAELNTPGSATENGLSCGAAGNCAVAGRIPADLSVPGQAFVDSRAAGDWSNAQEILGISNLPDSSAFAASCPPSGSCLVGGHYTDAAGHQQAYISAENTLAGTKDFGAFGGAQQVAGNLNTGGNAAVSDISCPRDTQCAVGGFYTDGKGHQQGFIADASQPTSTTLTLSAAKVKAGHEQAEHLTVRVKPATSGTPAGKVTIKAGSATLCVITLKGAKGSCTLTARKLRPGRYQLTARYGGGTPYGPSTSPKKALTVTK
jgi:hypothetical protein